MNLYQQIQPREVCVAFIRTFLLPLPSRPAFGHPAGSRGSQNFPSGFFDHRFQCLVAVLLSLQVPWKIVLLSANSRRQACLGLEY